MGGREGATGEGRGGSELMRVLFFSTDVFFMFILLAEACGVCVCVCVTVKWAPCYRSKSLCLRCVLGKLLTHTHTHTLFSLTLALLRTHAHTL